MSDNNHKTDHDRNRAALISASRDICRRLGIVEPDMSRCRRVVDFVTAINHPMVNVTTIFNRARRNHGYQPIKQFRQLSDEEIESLHKLTDMVSANAAALMVGRTPKDSPNSSEEEGPDSNRQEGRRSERACGLDSQLWSTMSSLPVDDLCDAVRSLCGSS